MKKNQRSVLRIVGIPEFLWYKAEKGIKSLREVTILKWIYCLKPEYQQVIKSHHQGHKECAGERGTSITQKFRDLLCRQELIAGDGLTDLDSLPPR